MFPNSIPKAIYVVSIALAALWLMSMWGSKQLVPRLPYSEFSTYLQQGKVQSIEIAGSEIHLRLKEPLNDKREFVTDRVDLPLAAELDRLGVEYRARTEGGLLGPLSWLLWPLGLWMLLSLGLRRAQQAGGLGPGQALSIGKSKAKIYAETETRVTFKDVAGVDEAKSELQEVVAFLRDPQRYGRLGARMPKGVLLVGPPGTGKTLLARAVAGEAGVPFFSINGSEFVEMFVGVGAARVRDLFVSARERAPSIIFIDELDALGRARNASPYLGGHDEKEQTLNQLLSEIDGFDSTGGVVLLAATNRPEILDAALLRAGRFDRQVLVDRPDRTGRVQILEVHTRKIKCAPDLALETVAAMTPGFTGADLANLCNEAALAATRQGAETVGLAEFTVAIERIVAGLEKKNRLLNPEERKIVAYHEAGHALVGSVLLPTDKLQKVSIIPRGIGALGYTLQRPTEDRYLMTRSELDNKLTVLMGGRAAEHLIFAHLSTGAADDLARATEIAHSMATRYGMVAELGHMSYEPEPAPLLGSVAAGNHLRSCSDQCAHEIEAAIRKILERAFDRALELLSINRAILEGAALRLLERETLTEPELQQVFAGARRPVVELKKGAA